MTSDLETHARVAAHSGALREGRILVHVPGGRDAELTRDILGRRGYDVSCVTALPELASEVTAGSGVVILSADALSSEGFDRLIEVLEGQPPWSDIPLVVFERTDKQPSPPLERVATVANVLMVERPIGIASLLSLVHTALRARRRQYEARDLLERLADNDRRKNEFLALLGHELRNPLGAISTATELLKYSEDPLVDRPRSVIMRQTRNLARMIEDLLDVSRAMLGKVRLHRELLDMNDVVSRAVSLLQNAVDKQHHELRFFAAEGGAPVYGDPVRLEQVMTNLLANAAKYTPDGGRIHLRIVTDANDVTVRVEDNGVGLTADMQTAVFEPFTQVDTSLDRAQGGLGLGLPLVRSLVELHGGTVIAESDGLGCGTSFEIRMPRQTNGHQRAHSVPVRPDTSPSATARHLDVLVVEDNTDLRNGMRDLIESWGHRVSVATDGRHAVAAASGQPTDIAFVDIGLPGIDGFGVARQLRATMGSTLPLYAMTGYGFDDMRKRAHCAGFDDFLVKPVDPDRLRNILRRLGTPAAGR